MEALYARAEYGKVVLKTKELHGPGPGQLLLEAEVSAISPGTEHSLMAGLVLPLPQNVGYSMVASVLEAGEGVEGFKPGDLVVATGEHASHLVLDERICTPAPKDIDKEQAAFFILAHTSMYGIRRAGIQLGEPVVVLGQGMVGSFAAQLARLSGAAPVIVTDIDDRRLEYSKEMGVHYAINTEKDPGGLKDVVDSLGMGGVPVVIEATGVRGPLDQAFEIVAERGRVIMLSTVLKDDAAPGFYTDLFEKGAALIGGFVNSKPFSLKRNDLTIKVEWPPILAGRGERFVSSDIWTSDEDIRVYLNLVRYGALDIRPLITHRYSAGQIPEAYKLVWDRDPSLLGGLIHWK
ncbi:MAG: zinc-binding alcohol dehydrogenase [Clostridiales bacterium]|nr:zinc-binding alcohol dehydrogenase [Clostridiales bacterium]